MISAALDDAARARLLALIGIERWVLRDRPRAPRPDAVAAAHFVTPPPPRLAIAAGDDAGREPLAGSYSKLLGHVLTALRVAPHEVAWSRRPDSDAPCLAFGGDASALPALAAVRGDAARKRELWRALRPIARGLRGQGT